MLSTLDHPSADTPLFEVDDQFSIDALTTSPKGFQAVGRGVTRLVFLENRPKPKATPEELRNYRDALRREEDFQHKEAERKGAQTYRAARDEYHAALERGSATPEELVALKQVADDKWRKSRGKSDKLNLHSLRVEGDTLYFDEVTKTPFWAYEMFATPEQSPELLSVSEAAAVAMVVITADNRLILQHRGVKKPHMLRDGEAQGNALYADIPGVSVAGMFDATANPDNPGAPKDITTEDVRQAIQKEAWEEVDLNPEDLDMRIVGVASDKLKPHTEFLLTATTKLTAAEMYERSRESRHNNNLGDADFAEKYIDIPATPEAIFTLLTEVRCPLPSTHAAAIVAAGYLMVLERGGQQVANEWRDNLEAGMNENYAAIDQMVADHYTKFPEATSQVPERYWGMLAPERNPSGYSPNFTPGEQGLPELHDELVRNGLIPETREIVSQLHLFDVDGVLTDPIERRVTEPELFTEIIRRLEAGEPVALNSGRSTSWVIDNFAAPLAEMVDDKSLLEKLSIIGEKGNTWATFNSSGELHRGRAARLSVDGELKTRIDQLVANNPRYNDALEDSDERETMISFVMRNDTNLDLDEFKTIREEFARDVKQILEELGKDLDFDVDETSIAVDVQSPHAGKALGADRLLAILKEMNINYKEARFAAYGDSISDAAMAEKLSREGLEGKFFFVGNNDDLPEATHYEQQNVGGYTQGTLRVLKSS